jgi:hypothetical protein
LAFNNPNPCIANAHACLNEVGGFAFKSNSISFANSSIAPNPKDIAIRRLDPKVFTANGKGDTTPLIVGFSKSNAFPPSNDFISRFAHSEISSSVATGTAIRWSSPARSNASKKCEKDS